MKTKNNLLFVIGLFAALCIGFLAGILVDYPKPDESQLAGTFGKAEKYRKVQMTAKDIQLRSELLKDTAQLRSMIQGLVYFSLFTGEVSSDIDVSIMAFKAQGMGTQALESDRVKALQEYSGFIRNNNKTLNSTIALLTGYYLKDTANLSQDVEKNLRDFGTYVNNLNEKFSVLNEALAGMDNFMLNNKTLQAHKTEITQLKSIRDQLLVKGIQLGGLLGNKEQVGTLISYAVAAQDKLALAAATEKLSLAAASEKLQFLLSQEGIQSALSGLAIATQMGNQDVAGSGLQFLYDKAGLQFLFLQNSPLWNQSAAAAAGLGYALYAQPLCLFGKTQLDVILNNYSLQDVIQSQVSSIFSSTNVVSGIFSTNNLQNTFLSTAGIAGIIGIIR